MWNYGKTTRKFAKFIWQIDYVNEKTNDGKQAQRERTEKKLCVFHYSSM